MRNQQQKLWQQVSSQLFLPQLKQTKENLPLPNPKHTFRYMRLGIWGSGSWHLKETFDPGLPLMIELAGRTFKDYKKRPALKERKWISIGIVFCYCCTLRDEDDKTLIKSHLYFSQHVMHQFKLPQWLFGRLQWGLLLH